MNPLSLWVEEPFFLPAADSFILCGKEDEEFFCDRLVLDLVSSEKWALMGPNEECCTLKKRGGNARVVFFITLYGR